MPGFGSGLAHALTQGVTGYQAGTDERMKQLIALAAQKRAEERAAEADRFQRDKFAHEVEQDRRANMIQGLIEGGTTVTPATSPDTGIPPINRTFDQAFNEGLGGNTHPADSSLTRTPSLGSIPHYDVQTTPDTFDFGASKQGALQAEKDAEARARQEAASEDRKQIAQMNNETRREIAGMRRDQQEPNWQTVTTADGSLVQVNPKTGATRPIGLKGKMPASAAGGGQTVAQKNKAAEVQTTMGTIDEALDRLAKHPNAVGVTHGRGISDVLDQWTDPEGVQARAALASVSSNLLHALSGAAISPSEYQRLRQYVPTTRDRYQAARDKLTRLRDEMQRSLGNMNAPTATRSAATSTISPPSTPASDGPRSVTVEPLTPTGGLSDADLWEQYRAKGLTPDQATKAVKNRRRQ